MSVRSKPNRDGEAPAEPERDGSELPEGWAAAALGQITRDISYGYTAKATDNDVGPKLLRITDIQDNAVNWGTVPFCEIDDHRVNSYRLSAGDLVFARTGATTGKSFLLKTCPDSVFASYLIRVRPSAALLSEYVAAFFQTRDYWNQITENLSGSAQPNCNASKLASLVVPIAPLAEQRRIVGKLELLLGKVSSSQQRLSRVPGLLKRFRQSVLAAACSGKLTADWREENDEPERDLDGDAIVAVEHLPLVPNTWTYRRAADIVAKGTVISYGMVLPGPNQPEGVPYIRGQDIDDSGNVHVDQLWKSTPQIAVKHRRSELLEGDVLLCVIRHLRVAIVPKGLDGANLTQGTVRLRPSSEILGSYLARCLASPQAQEWMKARYIGMAMPRINVEHARDIPVPLPPLSEQQEIVRRVENLFAFADQIEARLRQAQAHVDRLTQSLLAKAFRGELVPTEHALAAREGRDYESASDLLERIWSDCQIAQQNQTLQPKRRPARKQ